MVQRNKSKGRMCKKKKRNPESNLMVNYYAFWAWFKRAFSDTKTSAILLLLAYIWNSCGFQPLLLCDVDFLFTLKLLRLHPQVYLIKSSDSTAVAAVATLRSTIDLRYFKKPLLGLAKQILRPVQQCTSPCHVPRSIYCLSSATQLGSSSPVVLCLKYVLNLKCPYETFVDRYVAVNIKPAAERRHLERLKIVM